jgi:hypothetical protein
MTSGSFMMMQAGAFRRRELETIPYRNLACTSTPASNTDVDNTITNTLCKGIGANKGCQVPPPTTSGGRRLDDAKPLFFRVASVTNLLLGGFKAGSDVSKCVAPNAKNDVGGLLDGSEDCFDGDQAIKIRMIEMYEAVCTKDGANTWDIKTCTVDMEDVCQKSNGDEPCDQSAQPTEESACISFDVVTSDTASGSEQLNPYTQPLATDELSTAILSDPHLLVAEYGFPKTGIAKSQEQCIKPMLQHFVEAMVGFGRVPSAKLEAKKDAAGRAYIEVENTMRIPLFQGCGDSVDSDTGRCTLNQKLWDGDEPFDERPDTLDSASYKFFDVQSSFILGIGSAENVELSPTRTYTKQDGSTATGCRAPDGNGGCKSTKAVVTPGSLGLAFTFANFPFAAVGHKTFGNVVTDQDAIDSAVVCIKYEFKFSNIPRSKWHLIKVNKAPLFKEWSAVLCPGTLADATIEEGSQIEEDDCQVLPNSPKEGHFENISIPLGDQVYSYAAGDEFATSDSNTHTLKLSYAMTGPDGMMLTPCMPSKDIRDSASKTVFWGRRALTEEAPADKTLTKDESRRVLEDLCPASPSPRPNGQLGDGEESVATASAISAWVAAAVLVAAAATGVRQQF